MSNVITMKTNTKTFHFQDIPIRVVWVKDTPWFVAADVCKALEMNMEKGTYRWLGRLETNEKSTLKISVGTGGGNPNVTIISESGLYKLILRSNKPQAKPFQNWVTQVVLPAIRRDGGYIAGEEKVATGEMSEDEFILKAMSMLKNKADRLEAVVEEHLKHLSVAEWVALNHLYVNQSRRIELGQAASYLCRENGYEIRKQQQHLPSWRAKEAINVGVYPKHILDEAALLVGIQGNFSLNLGVTA